MLDREIDTETVELAVARGGALAQAEQPVGEFLVIACREEALSRGYGHTRSPQMAQRVAITWSQVSTVVLLNQIVEGTQHAMTATHSTPRPFWSPSTFPSIAMRC